MAEKNDDERGWLTVPEAGRLFGLGRSAAYAAAGRGELPTLRFGKRLICPRAKVLEMLGELPDKRPAAGE